MHLVKSKTKTLILSLNHSDNFLSSCLLTLATDIYLNIKYKLNLVIIHERFPSSVSSQDTEVHSTSAVMSLSHCLSTLFYFI